MTPRSRPPLALFVMVVGLALSACANSEPKPTSDAAAGAGGGDAASSTSLSCQEIRLCIFNTPCNDDACVAGCAAKGTAAAQAAFSALRTCTANACANDLGCACIEQCQANGRCLHEADTCLGTVTTDDICDQICA